MLVPIKDAARHLGIVESALRKMTRRGQVPHVFFSRKYFYDLDLLDEHVKRQMLNGLTEGCENGKTDSRPA